MLYVRCVLSVVSMNISFVVTMAIWLLCIMFCRNRGGADRVWSTLHIPRSNVILRQRITSNGECECIQCIAVMHAISFMFSDFICGWNMFHHWDGTDIQLLLPIPQTEGHSVLLCWHLPCPDSMAIYRNVGWILWLLFIIQVSIVVCKPHWIMWSCVYSVTRLCRLVS